ncbi:hypothetical protein ACXR0O_19240 [Verrucomicrobiota bacterium sgz303538]
MDPLFALVANLARRHSLGTVGIAGDYARGTQDHTSRLAILVRGPIDRAEAFVRELAEASQLVVTLYDVERLPWPSPLHLSVRWVNVDTLPRVLYPRGAVSLIQIGDLSARVPLENIPHMQATDGPIPSPRPGRFSATFRAPVGGFLI